MHSCDRCPMQLALLCFSRQQVRSWSKCSSSSLQRCGESGDGDAFGRVVINGFVQVLIACNLCFFGSQGTKSVFTRIQRALELTAILLDEFQPCFIFISRTSVQISHQLLARVMHVPWQGTWMLESSVEIKLFFTG